MPSLSRPLSLALSLLAGACNAGPAQDPVTLPAPITTARAGDPKSLVEVGSPPPDFSATASNGTAVNLGALKGKSVLVYFYPKDESPGCTREACAFRDAWEPLSKAGLVIVGVSADADDSHNAFATRYKLPFLLVSDRDGRLASSFGVPVHEGSAARQSFLIGSDGLVKKIYRRVDVETHAGQVLGDMT